MKDIPGYEGLYAITEDGKVWSYITNKFLKPKILTRYSGKNSKGYTRIRYGLCKNNKRKDFTAARLVAITYIPNPKNLPQVDHIDRDSTNNNVSNLRWVTSIENNNNKNPSDVLRAVYTATLEVSRPIAQIDMQTNEIINTFPSSCNAARIVFNDVRKNSLINRCARNKRKSAYGYYWKFI